MFGRCILRNSYPDYSFYPFKISFPLSPSPLISSERGLCTGSKQHAKQDECACTQRQEGGAENASLLDFSADTSSAVLSAVPLIL